MFYDRIVQNNNIFAIYKVLKRKLLWKILSVQTGSTIRIAGDAKLAAIISPQSNVKKGIFEHTQDGNVALIRPFPA